MTTFTTEDLYQSMDAYQLAEHVDMWGRDLIALNMRGGVPCILGAKMLRQQADQLAKADSRIAELERKAKAFEQSCRVATTQIKALQAELETNAEPVAFIKQGADGKPKLVPNPLHQISYQSECAKWDDIPLYMTPQTNAEPVAWGMRFEDGNIYDCICPEEHDREEGEYTIPLYTTPQTKPEGYGKAVPLSDEEIEELAIETFGMPTQEDMSYHIDFARAIEERHGIK